MKKPLLFLLPLLLAGCISRHAGNGRQVLCDSINAAWPLQVGGIELSQVSHDGKSCTIHIVSPDASGLEYANEAYYADEELPLAYGTYGAPYNEFVRELRAACPAFDDAVDQLSEVLWDGESNQGYLPLYIEIKARRDATNSIKLMHNDGW